MPSSLRDNIRKGTVNCQVTFHFKKDVQISFENPLLIEVVKEFLRSDKPPKITKSDDCITFINFLYSKETEDKKTGIENLSVHSDRISIRLFDETAFGESIIEALIATFSDKALIRAIDDKDIDKQIRAKTYTTRVDICLGFSLEKLVNSQFLSAISTVKDTVMKKTKVKEISPVLLGFAADIGNAGSEMESMNARIMFFGYTSVASKKKNIYNTMSDFPFDKHIAILQVINDKFTQK